ncbi:MAG: aspartate 1-decarboxylase [Desulfovibrio sp.]|uniref:aspartate 1-decarboxylase n=1 Tax=Desulfovibrio sp. TaxID=885 RepID=UPI0039E45817
MIEIVRSKLHGLHVTGCDLEYHGSITLDPLICRQAGMYPMEFVYIWNKNSGQRISTYVIYGEPGSRCCVLNGAAARTCQKGDAVIICASMQVQNPDELYTVRPNVLTFDNQNNIIEHFQYNVFKSKEFEYDFRIDSVS